MTQPAQALPQTDSIVVRSLGLREYEPLWRRMQRYTGNRSPQSPDEIWFTEHPSVFTLGLNASRDHLLATGDIPVIQVDRGGQVTYHGPGQLMIYALIDLQRAGLGVRDMVSALERTVVDLLAGLGIESASRQDAPGVYAGGRKVASVGLRVRRGACYHGMALNVAVDLEPFSRIDPCGFSDLEVTNLAALGVEEPRAEIETRVLKLLLGHLRMSDRRIVNGD